MQVSKMCIEIVYQEKYILVHFKGGKQWRAERNAQRSPNCDVYLDLATATAAIFNLEFYSQMTQLGFSQKK